MSFEKEKQDCLSRIDKSNKGSVDERMLSIITLINASPCYYTTSSCSGRILLVRRPASQKKCDVSFLFASHEEVTYEEIKRQFRHPITDDLWFRQESFILHVCCRELKDAGLLLKLCSAAGLKHAGIISVERKIVVELISSEQFDTIIAREGRLFVSDEHLALLVAEANRKLRENWARLEKMHALMVRQLRSQACASD